jgi:hypothetical protein
LVGNTFRAGTEAFEKLVVRPSVGLNRHSSYRFAR